MVETVNNGEFVLYFDTKFDINKKNKNLEIIATQDTEASFVMEKIYSGSYHLEERALLNFIKKEKLSIEDVNIVGCTIFDIYQHWYGGLINFVNEQWEIPLQNYIPIDRGIIKHTKPRGKILLETYELCKECHSLQSRFDINILFKTAYDWFAVCWWDFIEVDIEESLFSSRLHYSDKKAANKEADFNPAYTIEVYNNNLKKALIDKRRKRVTDMRNGINPFKNYSCAETLNLLVDASLRMSVNKGFKNRYWEKFLVALSSDCREMQQKQWGCARNENGEYVVGSGKGGKRKNKP
ncbi:MAG: hypothetical protein PT118_18525 [Aphanizomenon gracile PMC644.10]|nr:hypothetical protein [Aphanizomenon gracile PMC627.10]MDM3861780.1 hypothetical protein [Aphanizomenon gracile PMC644.10]